LFGEVGDYFATELGKIIRNPSSYYVSIPHGGNVLENRARVDEVVPNGFICRDPPVLDDAC